MGEDRKCLVINAMDKMKAGHKNNDTECTMCTHLSFDPTGINAMFSYMTSLQLNNFVLLKY